MDFDDEIENEAIEQAPEVNTLFMPGQTIDNLKALEGTLKVVLGPGLQIQGSTVVVTKVGILRFKEPNVYWLDSHQRRVRKILFFFLSIFFLVQFKSMLIYIFMLEDIIYLFI